SISIQTLLTASTKNSVLVAAST
ncbi:outer membrane transport family protein, partial [Vibrio parahaemolyticus V-223/04]